MTRHFSSPQASGVPCTSQELTEAVAEYDKPAQSADDEIGRLRGDSGVERLELRRAQDVERLAAELLLHPEVELAEPNFIIRRSQVAPDDPRFAEQWALRNTGQSSGLLLDAFD